MGKRGARLTRFKHIGDLENRDKMTILSGGKGQGGGFYGENSATLVQPDPCKSLARKR